MSKNLFSQIASALTLLMVAFLFGYAFPATVPLKLSRPDWDFGSIEQGETETQKIVMTNSGDQLLTIEKIELPEGLSVKPSLDNTEIQPEKDLEVEFTFDSKGILGQIQQYAYVFVSGGDEKSIVSFTIKGEVSAKSEPRLRVTPQTWDFGTVTTGDPKKQVFRCENVGTADLEIEKIQIYDSRFKVGPNIVKQTLAPGEKVDFVVSVTGTRQGRYDTDFYVKSNSASGSFTKVGIKGYGVSKTLGLVISSTLSSVTNNTPYRAEITRTDKLGKTGNIVVERNSKKSFPQEPGVRPSPTDLENYTLTVKLVRPPLPGAKPAERKPAAPSPKPEAKPAEEKPPEAITPLPKLPAAKPEKPEPSKSPEGEEQPAPKPEGVKISDVQTPPAEKPPSEKPEKAEPPEKPEQKKEEKIPEKSKEKKEPAAVAPSEKKEPEKPPQEPPSKPDETKSPEGKTAAPPSGPEKSSGSEEPPKDPAKKAPGAG